MLPGNVDLIAARAHAYNRAGDKKRAHELSDGAFRQPDPSAYCWIVRGELMVASRPEVERHCFDKAQQLDSDWLVPIDIAHIYLYYNNPSKALDRVRLAVKAAPDCYYPWYLQGVCQKKLGFNSQAQKCFKRCLDLCPRDEAATEQLAKVAKSIWSPIGLWLWLFRRQ